ncbi:CIP4 protein, partial [Amia calva]|nr:CIP4 protein [Amia calva]
MNDYAGQREVISENMMMNICVELTKYLQEIKQERKMYLAEGRKAQQFLDSSFKQLDSSKKRFEREWREAEKAAQYAEKTDQDINATKADVEKAKLQAHRRMHAAEECKNDYASQLQKYNKDQNQYYFSELPDIFNKLQKMDERRVQKLADGYNTFAETEKRVMPIIGKCLDGIAKAASSINERNDSLILIEMHKSGFERPGDLDFEDYSQGINRASSDSSLGTPKGPLERSVGKNRNKLWPFSKKSQMATTHPPTTTKKKKGFPLALSCTGVPTSSILSNTDTKIPGNVGQTPGERTHPLCLKHPRSGFVSILEINTSPQKISSTTPPPFPSSPLPSICPASRPSSLPCRCLDVQNRDYFKDDRPGTTSKIDRWLLLIIITENCVHEGRKGAFPLGDEDFAHLPPEQRRKKLQQKIDELGKELQKEVDQSEALNKMKDVYEKNPQMGDPNSLAPQINQTSQNMDRLRGDLQKYESWLAEAGGRGEVSRYSSFSYNNNGSHEKYSPDGAHSDGSNPEHPQGIYAEFDDDFEDEDSAPPIGQCTAMYSFAGASEGTISMAEGEIFNMVEEDKGDGWTRVRRANGDEGYIPTSYVKIHRN